MLQLFKTFHIFGAAVFIGYGLFGALWHAFVAGNPNPETRRFVLLRLLGLDVLLSVGITGLIMGGGFRMLRVLEVENFTFPWVWQGFVATVAAFFLLAFVIAPLTFWTAVQVKRGHDRLANALTRWTLVLRGVYLALPVFATVVMVYKPM